MKKILTILTLLTVLILACTPSEPVTEPVIEPVEEVVEEPTPEAEEVEEESEESDAALEITDDAQGFLDKAEKLESFTYKYGELNQRNTYSVMGNLVRVDLLVPTSTKQPERVDIVYLDTEAKTAHGICKPSKCGKEYRHVYRELDYATFAPPQDPMVVFDDVKGAELTGERKLVNDRDSYEIIVTGSNVNYNAFLDNFYGFPHELTIISEDGSEKLHQFFDVEINNLDEEDVTLPDEYEQIPNAE